MNEIRNHERLITDEVRDFIAKVEEKLTAEGDRKIVNGKETLTFSIHRYYWAIYDIPSNEGRNWKDCPKALEKRIQANKIRLARGDSELKTPVKQISKFFPTDGYCPPDQALDDRSIMAKCYNNNDYISTAYTVLRGLKFFWEYKEVASVLSRFKVPSENTRTALNSIGNLSVACREIFADMVLAEKDPATSTLFVDIRRKVKLEKNRREEGNSQEIKDAEGMTSQIVEPEIYDLFKPIVSAAKAAKNSKDIEDKVIVACQVQSALWKHTQVVELGGNVGESETEEEMDEEKVDE